MNDREIILKIKKGEIDNFSFIVNKYTKIVFSFLRRKLYDYLEVEDLVQNTFLKFYKNIDKFDEERPILPYLLQIAKNEFKLYLRDRKPTFPLPEDIADEQDISEVRLDIKELSKDLSPDELEIAQLIGQGYTYKEISLKLKKPLNTIKTKVRRTRLKLNKSNHGKA